MTDPEQKKELAAIFEALCIATQEFCEDHGFPQTWAWQYADIDKEPTWLAEVEKPQPTPTTGTGNGSGNGTGTVGGAANGADTGSDNGPGTAAGTGNDDGTNSGAGSGSESGSGSDGDTEMRDVTEALNKVTLDGEPIISKRQVFKSFQFLVEESSGLYLWKSAQLCGDLKPENIPSVEKLTKEFIAQYKHRYKGMRWIAMSVEDAIT